MQDTDEKYECVLQPNALAVLDVRRLAEHLGISPIAGQTNRKLCEQINEKLASGEAISLPIESLAPGAVPEFNEKAGFTTIRIQYKYLKSAVKVRAIDYVAIERAEDKVDEHGRVRVFWSGFQNPTAEPYDAVKTALEQQRAAAAAVAVTATAAKDDAPAKRRKLSRVITERRYVAVPPDVGEISLPDEATLLQAGKAMLSKHAPRAVSKMSKWWKIKAADELTKLVNIDDNLECGDCMYHALAPMVRAMLPQRFVDVPNEREPTMLRLRQLLASQLSSVDAENELPRYIAQYAQDFDTAKERNAFSKKFLTIIADREKLLADLQENLMQTTHWAHLADFELLNRLLTPAGIATVVINGQFNEKQPRNPAMQNISVQQLRNPNTRYLLVLHSGNHFTRLQSADSGQFVFTQRQLQHNYPVLWRTLTQVVEPSSDALQVNALVQDVAKDFAAHLSPSLKPILMVSDGTMHYDRVVRGLFNVANADIYAELLQRDERVGRYRSLSEAEKADVRQNLIDKKMQTAEALQARIDELSGQKTIAAAAAQKTVASAAEASTAQFCNEPSSSEKEQVAEAFENAQADAAAVDNANAQLTLSQSQRAASTGPIDVEEFTDVDKKNYRVFTTVGDISLRSDSVLRLRDNAWLNDDVINSYITVLLTRGAKAGADVDAVSTHFYTALQKAATERDLEQAESKFIGKEFHPFRLRKLFIPIHSGNHWALVMVDFGQKRIAYFDSYCKPKVTDAAAILHNVRRYLHFKAEKDPHSGFRDWTEVRPDVPQQNNATDCGVFLLAFLEEAIQKSFDDRFRVSQANISCFRKRILLALLANNGLPKVERRRLPPILPPLPAQSTSATATSAKQVQPPKLSFHDSDEWSVEAVDSADATQSQDQVQVKGVKVIGF